MMKKFISLFLGIFLLLISSICSARVEPPGKYVIDASKNATRHNNLGLIALENKDYFGAIEEFTVAIKLNPNTHATSVYYNNMGRAYLELAAYSDAQVCFERAITQFNLNFMFYQNLVKCFKAQGLLNSKISEYKEKSEKNPLSKIILGLCYIENGQIKNGIIVLDSFCMSEPDLIITPVIQAYLREITQSVR